MATLHGGESEPELLERLSADDIAVLVATDAAVTSLDGLQEYTALHTAKLAHNSIPVLDLVCKLCDRARPVRLGLLLHSMSLDDLQTSSMESLRHLYISNNRLTSLHGLAMLPALRHLDASCNALVVSTPLQVTFIAVARVDRSLKAMEQRSMLPLGE